MRATFGTGWMLAVAACAVVATAACTASDGGPSGDRSADSERPFPDDPDLWPSVRADRIATLLGPAMARAEVDAWLVLARENANDPIAAHIGAENAGGLAAFLFFATESGELESLAISPETEATALHEVTPLDSVRSIGGLEAYAQIVPGVTTDADVAHFLERRMAELGVEDGWAADQNPNVNSGPDRGHAHATDKVIQPGDVIQTDFGIEVHGRWVTDIQRFAYVLREGETEAPPEMQARWEHAKEGSRAAFAEMAPGVTGWAVDVAQRRVLEEHGSIPIIWSTGHPVGYWAHDVGPRLGGATGGARASGDAARPLRPGQVFAFDGFFGWTRADGTTKTISVEEMAVITDEGAEWLVEPQEEWVLVPSSR